MKIAVLSDCRVPTRSEGGHGLGRMAWDLASGLRDAGHEVTLSCGSGSDELPIGATWIADSEGARARWLASDAYEGGYQVFVDLSHKHDLSRLKPELPVVNWIVDLECAWQPPRAVVGNAWQQKRFPMAKIVPLGIDVDAIPFIADAVFEVRDIRGNPSKDYLAFAAKILASKGADVALEVHTRQGIPVRFVGERFRDAGEALTPLPWHQDELVGADFYRFLGGAWALLSPSKQDAGGRVNLEAAACGTPTLCLDHSGTAAHVEHGVSGFLCRDVDELVEAIPDCGLLDRAAMRAWVKETHDLSLMVSGVEALCQAVADGESW